MINTREIAKRCKIQHADIVRRVRVLLSKNCLSPNTQLSNFKSHGRINQMYILDKFDGEILINMLIASVDEIVLNIQDSISEESARQPIEELGSLDWWRKAVDKLNSKPEPHRTTESNRSSLEERFNRMKQSLSYKMDG